MQPGDILVYRAAEGGICHASYHLGAGLFFNKSGQTCFHPWKIINRSQLDRDWSDCSCCLWRRQD